ncbi:MAG TPA: hypothetical protein VGK45_17550 [Thermoanaerobaculia bacterium]
MARLRLIGLVGETLSISLAHLPVLLALSFLTGLPLLLASTPWGQSSYEHYLGLILLGLTTWNLRAGFAMHLVAGALEGRRVHWTRSLRVGTEEASAAIRVAAILGATIWLVFLLAVVPGLVMARVHPGMFLAGMCVFSGAGIWLASVFGVSVPLAIREKTSVADSLRRSARLSQGHRWLLALLVAVFAGTDLVAIRLLAPTPVGPGTMPIAPPLLLIVIGALGAPVLPVVYFHLRRGSAQAAVFD